MLYVYLERVEIDRLWSRPCWSRHEHEISTPAEKEEGPAISLGTHDRGTHAHTCTCTLEHFFVVSFQILISQGVELWAWLELASTCPSPIAASVDTSSLWPGRGRERGGGGGGGEGERREGDFIFNHAERSKEFPAHQSNVSGGHWTDPLPPQYIHCCMQTDLNANERLTKYNSIQNADYCTLDLLCVRVHVHACIHVVLTDRCWPARPHFPSLSH